MGIDFTDEMDTHAIVSPSFSGEDASEQGLRPRYLSDYLGQENLRCGGTFFISGGSRRYARRGAYEA